jgi:hypothetical protein
MTSEEHELHVLRCKRLGRCTYGGCKAPARPKRQMCQEHADVMRAANSARRKKYQAKGLCGCGNKLPPDRVGITCYRCIGKVQGPGKFASLDNLGEPCAKCGLRGEHECIRSVWAYAAERRHVEVG